MKICSKCGAEMEDNAVFCPECGGVPEQEKKHSPRRILGRVASGNLILFAAIFLTIGLLISVASSFLLPKALINGLSKVSDAVSTVITQMDSVDTAVPQAAIDNAINQVSNTLGYAGKTSVVITVCFSLVPFLVVLAFWLIYGSAKSGKVSTGGFTILQILKVIGLVFLVLGTIGFSVGCGIGKSQLASLGINNNIQIVKPFVFMAVGFILTMLIIRIVLNVLTIRTIKSCKIMIREKYYNEKLSAAAAVAIIIEAGANIVSGISVAFLAFLFGPAFIVLAIASLCSSIAPVLYGIAILKCKFMLED